MPGLAGSIGFGGGLIMRFGRFAPEPWVAPFHREPVPRTGAPVIGLQGRPTHQPNA
jgi:hypothetical protein